MPTCFHLSASSGVAAYPERTLGGESDQPGTCCPRWRLFRFMDDSPLKNAYGMEHLLDNIPYRQAKEIRREMREYFGTTHFYRLKRKERCFTPEDQLYVRDLLRQYNIEEEPLFDRYEENFGWERCSDTIA